MLITVEILHVINRYSLEHSISQNNLTASFITSNLIVSEDIKDFFFKFKDVKKGITQDVEI